MIVGLPTETVAEARRSHAIVRRLKRQGVLTNYKYNALQILPFSEMAREPERFGITRLAATPGNDLTGVITDFDCQGMSRRQALRLCIEFNDAQRWYVDEVKPAGRRLRVRHDLIELQSRLLRNEGR